jgi:NAD(P)-dependent dehydrogenase (short-subunit alcohol dehydrogenase family)
MAAINDEKKIIISGASDGIGFETAKQLALKGFEIIMIGKNAEKLSSACERLKKLAPATKIHSFTADLSLQADIKRLSTEIHNRFSKIDVLINNAGAAFSKFELTSEGLEKTIATNHFNYFRLTFYLLDLLKRSRAARIVNVASNSHYPGKIDLESFTKNKNYFILRAYEQSKLANVIFTYELARRLGRSTITVNALHPGRVKTNMGNKAKNPIHSLGWTIAKLWGSVSVEEGAKTSVYLATSEEVKETTAEYFADCKPKKSSALSYDKELARELWEYSEQFSNIKFL